MPDIMSEVERFDLGVVPRDFPPEIIGQMALLGEFPEPGVFDEQLELE